jgi:hypothetical protein
LGERPLSCDVVVQAPRRLAIGPRLPLRSAVESAGDEPRDLEEPRDANEPNAVRVTLDIPEDATLGVLLDCHIEFGAGARGGGLVFKRNDVLRIVE